MELIKEGVPIHMMEPIFSAIIQEMGHGEQGIELLEGRSFTGSNNRHESGSNLPRNEVGFALFAKSIARFLSITGSSELIRSSLSGPRTSFAAAASEVDAA